MIGERDAAILPTIGALHVDSQCYESEACLGIPEGAAGLATDRSLDEDPLVLVLWGKKLLKRAFVQRRECVVRKADQENA